ncbi:PilZ domain-containing protein [Hyalangium rubrum]|uniref:PilZ domain-containing protein n=1 Tax=Hyalangium rubrum TaxID=3103134 RepID=A0ABU5HFU5_9BACT|nr:PilZ domain-containing protein [Hyalangium sp. s54d21]MDY7232323.1 PilZ domain-containing protein [Hyalangium sp. s54d21]
MYLPRALPRQAHRFAVRLRGMLPVYTRDVSPSGFQADMLQPMQPGTPVRGTLALEGAELPFEGEVVWTRQYAGEHMRGRYGVRFTSLPSDFTRRLLAYGQRQGRRLVRWFR